MLAKADARKGAALSGVDDTTSQGGVKDKLFAPHLQAQRRVKTHLPHPFMVGLGSTFMRRRRVCDLAAKQGVLAGMNVKERSGLYLLNFYQPQPQKSSSTRPDAISRLISFLKFTTASAANFRNSFSNASSSTSPPAPWPPDHHASAIAARRLSFAGTAPANGLPRWVRFSSGPSSDANIVSSARGICDPPGEKVAHLSRKPTTARRWKKMPSSWADLYLYMDAHGDVVDDATNTVRFTISGPGSIAGTSDGNPASHIPNQAHYSKAFYGRCMVLIRAGKRPGSITVTAHSKGLPAAQIVVRTRARRR